MPFIKALEDAGLSTTPSSQDIDAVVFAGQRLAVDWVQRQDNGNGLCELRLAGNYTCPETRKVLSVGDVRFINSTRFDIPAEAWLATQASSSPAAPLQSPERAAVAATGPSASGVELKSLAFEMLKRLEGFSEKAYPDPGTKSDPWTIGYGFTRINNRSVQPGQTITRAEADALLSIEIDDYVTYLSGTIPYWAEMSTQQQCTLTSFAFNNGRDFYGGP